MGNIIGESIPKYVGDQIKKRQEVYGSGTTDTQLRSLDEISYLNSRNGWVKLASGVSIDKDRLKLLRANNNPLGGNVPGKILAQKNVLFGGLSSLVGDTLEPRQGIEGANRAYGIGGTDFGFSPMPGIIDASIKSLNRGSLKKATINIKAHNKNQLDIIDVLYMRLGYTVLLEWGNDKYYTNPPNSFLTEMGPTLIEREFFQDKRDRTDYTTWLPLIEKEREEKAGNYEAMFGVISNFSWTFESDGSYSVRIDIISMGDVIESLKVNTPVSNKTIINNLSKEKFLESDAGKKLNDENTPIGELDKTQFLDKYRKTTESGGEAVGVNTNKPVINITEANKDGYYRLEDDELMWRWKRLTILIDGDNHRKGFKGLIQKLKSLKENEQGPNNSLFSRYNIPKFKTIDEQIRWFEQELLELQIRKREFENYYDPITELPKNQIYVETVEGKVVEGKVNNYSENWYFVNGNYDLWLLKKYKGSNSEIGTRGLSDKDKEEYNKALQQYTTDHQNQTQARETLIKTQIDILKESKLSYLFFSIEEITSRIQSSEKPKKQYDEYRGNTGNMLPIYLRPAVEEQILIGGILNTNKEAAEGLSNLGIDYDYGNKEADIIFLDKVSMGEKGENAYYIRFGVLLDYIQNHIFPKIVSNNIIADAEEKLKAEEDLSGTPLLKIDTEVGNNVMYTIPNQLSTNPQVCLIKNTTRFSTQVDNTTFSETKQFFVGLDSYIGTVGDIYYGKIMNIYLNFTYLKSIISSEGVVNKLSIYKFLNTICDGINDSLGGVNNLEPVINESTNTIYILEQTKIPGKEQLIKSLNIDKVPPPSPPELEIFGYEGIKSNFIRNVGLQTAITKEYATMITIGATAGGYIPGEEATAFSRWNKGIEDRFKVAVKESDSDTKDPIETFERENDEIKNQYGRYINQSILNMVGINWTSTDAETKTPNSEIIKQNTATVTNFNKYLQASASLANPDPKNVETSVGFLPFNLSLTMDGIGGFKIYNKLEVNTKFLPSNYKESMEFVITGVDHKLSNNEWVTDLSTIGTSIGSTKPSLIKIGTNIPSLKTHGKIELSGKTIKTSSGWDIAVESFGYKYGEKSKERIKMLFLHHTAGHQKGNAKSVVDVFNDRATEGNAASTHDVIDPSGNLERVVPVEYFAWAQGVTGMNYNSIGYSVELMALGYFTNLTPDGKQWTRGDGVKVSPNEVAPGVDFNLKAINYKGYPVYQKYTPKQITTTIKWIKDNLKRFQIKGWVFNQRSYNMMFPPATTISFDAKNYKPGVYTHNSVRKDKSDIFPQKELIVALKSNFSKPVI